MTSAPRHGLCLLLQVQQRAGGQDWHARVLAADGAVLDFDSPFELVRFLSRATPPLPPTPPPGAPGLR